MDAYTGFAEVYDLFMDNIPYEEWCGYVTGLLRERGIEDGLVLDLGCGTGTLTELLAQKGYDMIGVDNAEDMLEIALEKKLKSGSDILYLLQDMREFELYGTVAAVVCICDSINYILEYEDLVQVFRLVNNYLDPGGVFIFDLNTEYKYREILGDATIAENRDESSFIWENDYDEETRINEYDLTLFIREENGGGLFRRYEEKMCIRDRSAVVSPLRQWNEMPLTVSSSASSKRKATFSKEITSVHGSGRRRTPVLWSVISGVRDKTSESRFRQMTALGMRMITI